MSRHMQGHVFLKDPTFLCQQYRMRNEHREAIQAFMNASDWRDISQNHRCYSPLLRVLKFIQLGLLLGISCWIGYEFGATLQATVMSR